jgi:phenylalanyl-tRNA synthetase beta chain
MTVDMEYLRTSLRPNLLSSFAANRRFEEGSIRLFEVGKVYLLKNKELPDEREIICGVMGGRRYSQAWQDTDLVLDFFDAKGIAEGLLQRMGVEPGFRKGKDISLHPNKQAEIFLEDKNIGVVGEVHPKVLLSFEINEPVYLVEIDLQTLIPFTAAQRVYQPISRFPAIVRDMALIVNADVAHQKVKELITGFPLVENVEIFDVYSGEQVAAGKKSMAYRISYRSLKHTLADEEITQVQQQILSKLSTEFGAVLRS